MTDKDIDSLIAALRRCVDADWQNADEILRTQVAGIELLTELGLYPSDKDDTA